MLTEEQINNEQTLIEKLEQRWMMGSDEGLSIEALPESWRPLFENISPEHLSLAALGLLSQHKKLLLRPLPASDLQKANLLPPLAKPTLMNHLRPLFRRSLEQVEKLSNRQGVSLLHLLEQRGYVAHPDDWLPSSQQEEFPEIYFPWVQWGAGVSSITADEQYETLTEAN